MSEAYETKVVDMTQKVITGWPFIVKCDPGPRQLKQLIAEYEEQGWEVVSVDVKPDSGRIFSRNDQSTIVTFKREKKDDNPVTDIYYGLTCYGEMWAKEGRPAKGFNTWDPMGYRRTEKKTE